jgi:hypothetical protein
MVATEANPPKIPGDKAMSYFFGGLTALASSLPNLFTSKRRSSSRNASSLARCFSLSGFFGFDRFRDMLELYRSDGRWASCRTS